MRVTAEGYARNHGPTEVLDIDLTEISAGENGAWGSARAFLNVERSPHPTANKAVRGVTLNCITHIRLGGEYIVRLKITKAEAARLFYLTHREQIAAFMDIFPDEGGAPDEKTGE